MPLTFDEFQDLVMTAFEQWPLRCKDRSDADIVYYSFEALNSMGPAGNYCDGEWTVGPKWSHDRFAKANSLEAAIAKLEAQFNS